MAAAVHWKTTGASIGCSRPQHGDHRRGLRVARGLLAGDRRASVADVDDDRPASRIEVLAAGRIADRRAGSLDRDRQVGVERATEDAAGHASVGRGMDHLADRGSGPDADEGTVRHDPV
jgi:hypothetical protein